jgi:hypothetical protein
MNNGDYTLTVDGTPMPLRRVDNVRFVTPARDAYPATTAARLARSSRIYIDTTFPRESLVVRGDRRKLEEVPGYRDIQNTRAAFRDPKGKVVIVATTRRKKAGNERGS